MNFMLYRLYELMIIGIDGSRAFLLQRTGIEEYSYQVIKHLRHNLENAQVILYIKHNQKIDFELPQSWRIKKLWSPRLWTQVRLSLELLFHPINVLFIPAHTVPIIHPKNTIVTIHGLEYEFVPDAYSWWAKTYMALIIKNSCRWAKKIIAVSKNTRQDLGNLYKVPGEKMEVIYEGYAEELEAQSSQPKAGRPGAEKFKVDTKFQVPNSKFLLFIGRLEQRKNISGIIEAFDILKEKYKVPHKLVLAGKRGYGYESAEFRVQNSKFTQDIILSGFISEEEKWKLLKSADVFLFPTFYEGFGLPILEAQSVGVPVVASNVSSIPEVTDGSAFLADPKEPEFIAKLAHDLISNEELRSGIIEKGYENVKRFSWDKCAKEIAQLIKING